MCKFLAALTLLFVTTSTFAQSFKLNEKGYIRNWLLVAPISLPEAFPANLDKEQIKDEAKLAPKAGDKVKAGDKELEWKAIQTTDFYFDINEILKEPMENVAAYAVAYVEAPEQIKDVTFSLCSNDQGKIYLNGKEIFKYDGGRGLEEDADQVKGLTLEKGTNTIVFKVINDTNNWQGCIRLLDKNDKPLTNVTVKLTK